MAVNSTPDDEFLSVFIFIMVVQAITAALLVGVILMQKSEGGGLGTGGSPTGFMSARGAADFLTRTTAILATAFVVLSIVLAAMAAGNGGGRKIDTSLKRDVVPVQAPVDPLAPVAPKASPVQAPAPSAS